MGKINFFPDNLDIQNQKVILRLDLNVPLIRLSKMTQE